MEKNLRKKLTCPRTDKPPPPRPPGERHPPTPPAAIESFRLYNSNPRKEKQIQKTKKKIFLISK